MTISSISGGQRSGAIPGTTVATNKSKFVDINLKFPTLEIKEAKHLGHNSETIYSNFAS